jgi:hypothetical protein
MHQPKIITLLALSGQVFGAAARTTTTGFYETHSEK